MFDNMFDGQETHAVMATALNHASTAMLFALSNMDEYTAFIHEKQASGMIAAGNWDGGMDTDPIAPDVLRHDLATATMLLHGLAHVAQDKAEDATVTEATEDIDTELSRLLGS